MESQATFVLLGLLYLACTVINVESVSYTGDLYIHEGQPWSIECYDLDDDDQIRWTRNGQTLEPELASGQLVVYSKPGTGRSKLSATQATESHDGDYKCVSDDDDVFHLSIYFDFIVKVVTSKDVPVVLECANKTAGDKVQWLKDKVPVESALGAEEKDLVKIDNETGNLMILKDNEHIFGNYSCKVANYTTTYRIVPRPVVTLADSTSVVEGEKLHLICAGKLAPGVKISWNFAGKEYNRSEGRVRLMRDNEKGIYGAELSVDNVAMEDRGDIVCKASYNWSDPNELHMGKAQTFLRVKDKLAALWPFLGICAEVVVLCAIILVYEKRRNKAELEESDTDQSPDTKPSQNKDSDVRQRK